MMDLPRIHLSITTDRMRFNIMQALSEHHDAVHQYVDDAIQRLTVPDALERVVTEEATHVFKSIIHNAVRTLVYDRLHSKETEQVIADATDAAVAQLTKKKRERRGD